MSKYATAVRSQKWIFCIFAGAISIALLPAQTLAQAQSNGQTCVDRKDGTPDCKPAAKKPFRKTDFKSPSNRKPPKPPKQTTEPKDELPERREDNF